MKRVSKTVLMIIAAALCVPFLFAGGAQEEAADDGIITLKIYTQYSDDTEKLPFDYAREALRQEMPNVELVLDIEGQDDDMRLKTYAAAGTLPDIINLRTTMMEMLIDNGNLAALDDTVAEYGLLDKCAPAARDAFFFKDHVYAVPKGTKYASAMFYNEEIFEQHGVKVPTNIDEFVVAVETFAAADVIPLALFSKEAWPGVQLYDMLLTRELPGGLLALDAGEVSIENPAFLKAAQKYKRIVDAGILARGAFNTAYDEAFALFSQGKAAMFLNGMWAAKDLGEAMGDKVKILPDYYPLADAGGETEARWHMSGGSFKPAGFGVNAQSEHLEVAKKAAVFLAYKFAEGVTVTLGTPALYNDTPATPLELTTVHKQLLGDTASYLSTTGFPWHISNDTVRVAVEDNVNALLAGKIDAEAFITQMKRDMQ